MAIASLVTAIEKFTNGRVFDMVLLTGDLAYSGVLDEYERFQQQVLGPLRSLSSFRAASFVAVPGNHDLDCDVGLPISWDKLGPTRQQEFFATSNAGRRLRQPRADGFREYQTFALKNNVLTCNPMHEAAVPLTIADSVGNQIELLCTNTAYFSDKEVSDKSFAPSPVDALREVFSALKSKNPIFVVGHHPIHWFTRDSANHLKSLLIEQNAVYLHGHMHEVESYFGPKGLVALGFGAGYQAPLSSSAKAYYRNTFALCELDDSLNIEFLSWDTDYGAWVPETRLPPDIQASREQSTNRYLLRLPTTLVQHSVQDETRTDLLSSTAIKARLNPPIWLDSDPKSGWVSLLEQLGKLSGVTHITTIGPQDPHGGIAQFVADDLSGRHLIRAFSAASSTITYSQIEQTNTFLDTESLDSCILITLGTLSDDASTLSVRLKEKKALSVLTGADIALAAARFPVVEQLRLKKTFDLERVTLTPLIVKDGVALLVVDATASAWLCVIGPDGSMLEPSAELTYKARTSVPALRDTPYWSTPSAGVLPVPEQQFDRGAYLERSTSLFDTVRYAGLAAIGLKMPIDSLRSLYVPAAADVAANQASQQALKTAVDDFIEALRLDIAQRDQLEMQLRNYYGLSRSAESGAATGFYQKYGAILVVGDPGSGKSCFVRNEILTYCQPPEQEREWYAKHTPVFLPLADAARTAGEGEELLDICVRFAASQRLEITRAQLDSLIARGEVAFFFDGVDEVGSLEIRQSLLRQIRQLMDEHRRHGNRFVVTSRPAAIHSTQIPDELTRLRLRGLTNEEIAILATRMLSIDAVTGKLMPTIRKGEAEIVAQLVRDCEEKPGIRRLARNPLLLTLLVLIYSNSGPLAARRHVIYSQAIKTLVSVRHRATKSRVLSEADLRQKLGTLALLVYRGLVSEIPSRQEVRNALSATGNVASGSAESREVDGFVQDVAETTGLIVIHPRSESHENDVISFMHHSFLEYYAAVGFMKEPMYEERAHSVALSPRWRDVITLMFGLLGEQGDISSFLKAISKEREPADRITASRLRMALECALECDVPPDEAQEHIAELLHKSLSDGSASVVADARAFLAGKVQELLQNTGSERVRHKLIAGVRSADPRASAAHVDFLSRMPLILNDDAGLRTAVTDAFQGKHSAVRIACISAVQAAPKLRTNQNLDEIRRSLDRGTITEQHAVLQLFDSEPALIAGFSDSVIEALGSRSRLIANLAARCVIVGGTFAQGGYENRGLLDRALRLYTQADGPQKGLDKYIDIPPAKLESLIFSDNPDDQKLGIRCLVAVRLEPAAVHGYLFSVLKGSTNHEVRTACLEAMATDARMIKSASLADTDLVCKCVSDRYSNVRSSAIQALKHFPSIDLVRDTLRSRYDELRAGGEEPERDEVIKSLAAHAANDKEVRSFIQTELVRILLRSRDGWGKRRRGLVIRLLHACEQGAVILDEKGSTLLFDVATDFRTPADVRGLAIRVFGRTSIPSIETGSRIVSLLDRPERPARISSYKAAGAFSDKCRGNVEVVRRVHPTLEALRAALISRWQSESKGLQDRIDFAGLRDIRVALLAIEEILTSYEEFSNRMKVAEFERQTILDLKT